VANEAANHPEFCRRFGVMDTGPLHVESSETFDSLEEALASFK
jgi:hypothetical protein